jgi:hypothetical protein
VDPKLAEASALRGPSARVAHMLLLEDLCVSDNYFFVHIAFARERSARLLYYLATSFAHDLPAQGRELHVHIRGRNLTILRSIVETTYTQSPIGAQTICTKDNLRSRNGIERCCPGAAESGTNQAVGIFGTTATTNTMCGVHSWCWPPGAIAHNQKLSTLTNRSDTIQERTSHYGRI